MDKTLGEIEIMFVLGINVRDAPAVAQDFDFVVQDGQGEIAVCLRQRPFQQPIICLLYTSDAADDN